MVYQLEYATPDPAAQIIDLVKRSVHREAVDECRLTQALYRMIERLSEHPDTATQLRHCTKALQAEAEAHRSRARSSQTGPILAVYWQRLAETLEATADLLGHYDPSPRDATSN